MSRRSFQNTLLLAISVVFLSFLSGCVRHDAVQETCEEDCYEYQQCQTICDQFSCKEKCQTRRACPSTCPDRQAVEAPSCQKDVDCGQGLICVHEKCVPRNDETGEAGSCQRCENAWECADPDARCVNLSDGEPGQKVCSTTCEFDSDCAEGFECARVNADPTVPGQCLPETSGGEIRSCDGDFPGLECTSADDCAMGESCVDNTCTPPEDAECVEHAECNGGEVCKNYECTPVSSPECEERSDCRSSEVCSADGECVPRSDDGCLFSSDCAGESTCVDGRCLSACQDRTDCNAREHCRDGSCQPIECRRNADCASGESCVDAECRPSCQADADCPSGFACSAHGYCESDPNAECSGDAQCADGEVCWEGACQTACNCNQQCPDEQVCDTGAGVCQDPEQSKEVECENDCDCPSGESCVQGTCEA